MLIRPDRGDLQIIGYFSGRIITGLGLVMLIPATLGFLRQEWNDASGLLIGAATALMLGMLASWRLDTRRGLDWTHAAVVVALSWLISAFIGAIPLYLSGHYTAFVDAYFDAMSGFATAGLSVINDLDHVSDGINLWRHMMQFLGGQGLVLVALSMFGGGSGGLTGLYLGEGREEKILPNVRRTAQFIWFVALLYLLVGTTALWVALLTAGMPLGAGLLHAVTLFMAAFDTGGFAPTSASLGFYHSVAVEAVASVLMVAGALSFAMHYQLMRRRDGYRALVTSTETRFLGISVVVLFVGVAIGLARFGTYEAEAVLRRGFFHLLSAHTGTGFGTVPGRLFVTDWGTFAPAILVFAMAFGAMAGSTAGGIKGMRLAVLLKSLVTEVRRILMPEDAVVVQSYNVNGTRQRLPDGVVRTAVVITLLYISLYFMGAALGLFYGYSIEEAMFESTSAAAAVGLSVGIVGPDLELPLKLFYIFQMWIGRLEFVSVLALFGYVLSGLRGRW